MTQGVTERQRALVANEAMRNTAMTSRTTISPTRIHRASVTEITAARAAEVGACMIVPKWMNTVQPIRKIDVTGSAETAGLPLSATRSFLYVIEPLKYFFKDAIDYETHRSERRSPPMILRRHGEKNDIGTS